MGLEYNPQSGDIPCFPLGLKNILNKIFLMFQNGKKVWQSTALFITGSGNC